MSLPFVLCRCLLVLLCCGTAALTTPAQAQWMPNFSLPADVMRPIILNPCLGERCDDDSVTDPQTQSAPPAVLDPKALTYIPSVQRRRANLQSFVEKMRESDPQGSVKFAQLIASTDVIGQLNQSLGAYGMTVNNVGDAYAAWWITAWEGARGSNRDFNPSELRAVREQAHETLLATPQLAESSDLQKQEMAEALLIQAAMIDSFVEMSAGDAALQDQLGRAIRKGALAMGVDLDRLVLTDEGFRPR